MIQWLHIADLHLKNKSDADQQNFCNALLKDCAEQRIKADFVVAVGDFHNIKDTDSESYAASQNFLQKLMKALNLDIQKDLFMVPGNHDVAAKGKERTENVQMFLFAAKLDDGETARSKEPADQGVNYGREPSKKSELLQKLLADFDGYRKMAGTLIQSYQEGADGCLDSACVHVRTWNNSINILHLNTAILSDGTRGHNEAIDIDQACSDQIHDKLNNGYPTIVLGHHSFHDLHPTIKKGLVQLFNQNNVWAYLAGDKHRTNYKEDDKYLIDRKIGIEAWPNILAGKMAAATDDDYSEFGAVLHCWDGHSTVEVRYLCWERRDSGNGLTNLIGRTYPMRSDVESKLYYNLSAYLAKTRDNHSSFRLIKIDDRLIPNAYLDLDGCKAFGGRNNEPKSVRPLSEFFRESWCRNAQNHLALVGEGGIGKTVALLSLTTKKDSCRAMCPRYVSRFMN